MKRMQWDRMGSIYNCFHFLINSGVFEFVQKNDSLLKDVKSRLRKIKDFGSERFRPMELSSNFLAVTFIICASLLALCVAVLTSELIYSKNLLWKMQKGKRLNMAS